MNSGPMLSIGSTGPDVRRLQVLFVMMKDLEYSDIDGNFGPKTQERVKDFQQGNNLTPDGVVGPLTWTKLPADPNTPRLARGATGAAVSGLQTAYRNLTCLTALLILDQSTGALDRKPSQLCAPIKPTEA
jgi:peptidoglycan hydrolase-like protein with peptidoglycan-binding domain